MLGNGDDRHIFYGIMTVKVVRLSPSQRPRHPHVKDFGYSFFRFLYFQKYLPHIWYGRFLEHWPLLYAIMSLELVLEQDQKSITSMMLMLKFLI